MDLAGLEIKVARSENLPILPQVVSTVLKMADDPNASTRDLERTIERDPAISGKLLRVANSPHYNAGSRITNIGRAVQLLGFSAVRSLLVGVAYQQMIGGRLQSKLFDRLAFWRHSIAAANAAKVLAMLRLPEQVDDAFVAGLMHDVGMLVLDRFSPEEFDRAIEDSQSEGLPIHVAEQELFGFDHTVVGAILADRWGIAGIVRDCIAYHHAPLPPDSVGLGPTLVCAADVLAHRCGYTNASPGVDYELPAPVVAALSLPPEQFEAIAGAVINEVERTEAALNL